MATAPSMHVASAHIAHARVRGDVEGERRARENLVEARLHKAIEKAIAEAPPLTEAARHRLAELLASGDA